MMEVNNFVMPGGQIIDIADHETAYPSTLVRNIVGEKAIFVGDSYSYGTGASDHLAGDTKRFTSLISEQLNLTEYNIAVGSTGFVDPGSSGQNKPFISQIMGWFQDHQDEADEIKAIFISGGYNDVFNTNSTFESVHNAVVEIISYCATHFNNAVIIVTPMLWSGHGFTVKAGNLYTSIVQGVMDSKLGQRVHLCRDAFTWTFQKNAQSSDGIHPNDVGHALIASCLVQSLNGIGSSYDTWQQLKAAKGTTFDNTPIIFQKGMYNYMDPFFIYFNSIESGSSAIVATAPETVCPVTNIYGPIYSANVVAGNWALTTSGSFYIFNTSGVSKKSCYVTPAVWRLYGKAFS